MTVIGAVSAHFRRDVEFDLDRVSAIAADAHERGVELLVLPHGVLGGYHDALDASAPGHAVPTLPPAFDLDGPEVAALAQRVVGLTLVCGITERVGDDRRANTALCIVDGEVVGRHRKVHLPTGERDHYVAGDRFDVVDTPHGRIGLLVDYDKTFPEAARSLAASGASILAIPCAWPASRTNKADTLTRDRQRRMFDLYDQARAAENQVVVVSANQIGRHGALRFFGQSKVVQPDGDIRAVVGSRAGMAVADIDVDDSIHAARRSFFHLGELRPEAYRPTVLRGS